VSSADTSVICVRGTPPGAAVTRDVSTRHDTRPPGNDQAGRVPLSDTVATTAIEYALMAGILAIVILVGVGMVGDQVGNYFDKLGQTIP